jgi:putative membrane protein
MPIMPEDHAAISAAIQQAEKRTSGQIVCVLAHASSTYATVPIVWAAFVALFAPWPLIYLTQWSVQRIYLLQIVIFMAVAFACSWMPLRMALVPRAIRRARAHRAAIQQFFARGVSRTRNRNGVLIYVSMAEHYARIVADEGIAAKVPQADWQSAVDALTGHMREGHVAPAFITAIERCGAVLAAHAPPDGAANELPDRLYVM